MRVRFAAVLIAVSSLGCKESIGPLPEPALAIHAVAVCEGTPESRYFPESAVRWLRREASGGPAAIAARILEAMREPSFACSDVPESYRVLWLHSFSSWPHDRSEFPPTMMRMSKGPQGWTATAVRLASSFNRTEI